VKAKLLDRSLLTAVILVAFKVRLAFWFQPLRYDEGHTFLSFVSWPLLRTLSVYTSPNNHLLHTLWARLSVWLLGNDPWALRVPALFFGILLVAAVFCFARVFYGRWPALLSAALVAGSSVLIEYSTNARGYTLLATLFLLLLVVAQRLFRQPESRLWLLFVTLATAGFYTVPIMLYAFGTIVTWMMLTILFTAVPQKRLLIQNLALAVFNTLFFTFILYSPILLIGTGLSSLIDNATVTPLTWQEFGAGMAPSLLDLAREWQRDLPWPVVLMLVAGFVTALLFHRRLASHAVPLPPAMVLACLPLLAAQRVVPFTRVWLFFLPLLLTVSAAGVMFLLDKIIWPTRRHDLRLAVYMVVILVTAAGLSANVLRTQSVYYSLSTGTLRDAEPITLFLRDQLTPTDFVWTNTPATIPILYHFRRYDLPVEQLIHYNLANSQRVIVVVNTSHNHTLAGILEDDEILRSHFGSPIVLKVYESATLYQMERLTP
jgi:uncharacterized membrane protein